MPPLPPAAAIVKLPPPGSVGGIEYFQVEGCPGTSPAKFVNIQVAKTSFLGSLVCLDCKFEGYFHGYNNVFLKLKYMIFLWFKLITATVNTN